LKSGPIDKTKLILTTEFIYYIFLEDNTDRKSEFLGISGLLGRSNRGRNKALSLPLLKIYKISWKLYF